MGIKVLVVDDHKLLREAVRFRLHAEEGMDVVGEAENGRVAVHLARELNPDVIIMEVGLPNMNGVEATHQILREQPGTKVIAFAGGLDRHSVQRMLAAGASGYVLKSCSLEELLAAIRDVMENRTYLSSQVCAMVVDGYVSHSADSKCSMCPELTAREREVLQLITEGKSTKMIAKELCLSGKTIDWHRSRIMKKLHIESIAGLVRYAMAEGLTSADLIPLASL
jgi:DNA-binding NarL/FixJ family response regulator